MGSELPIYKFLKGKNVSWGRVGNGGQNRMTHQWHLLSPTCQTQFLKPMPIFSAQHLKHTVW